jgi:hypothetical protein
MEETQNAGENGAVYKREMQLGSSFSGCNGGGGLGGERGGVGWREGGGCFVAERRVKVAKRRTSKTTTEF